jgi:general secretion pathway protein A
VNHRLTVSGAMAPIFTTSALRTLQRMTRGIPRLINIICDRALLGAYTHELRQVDAGLVKRAAREVLGEAPRRTLPLWLWFAAAALAFTSGALLWFDAHTPAPLPAVAEAAEPRPVAADLDAWLTDPAHASDTDSAFDALFKLWGAQYSAAGSGSACREADVAGLRCLYRRGTWNNLRGLNLPAIVTLTDKQGAAHQLVVTQLDDGSVTLRAGAASARFPIAEVEPLWYGEYLILWRPDSHATQPLQPGMVGTGVAWLRAELAALGQGRDSGDTSYDESLAAAVRRFQADQHMKVDGIAGEETLVRLSAVRAAPGTPLLSSGGH